MTINKHRRALLQGVSLGSLASAVPLASAATAKAAANALQRNEFPVPDFDSLLGDLVTIDNQTGHRVKAEVVEVADLAFDSNVHQRPVYLRPGAKLVRLEVQGDEQFQGDLCTVSHRKLGQLQLLLTQVPNKHGKLGLEVIFN